MLCRASERWNSRRWAKRRDQVRQIQRLIDALEGLRQAQLVRESLAGSNGAALARAGPGDVTADSVSVVIDRRPKLTETPGPASGCSMRPRVRAACLRGFFPLPCIPTHPALSLHGDVP